jgi:hypothetical protein
MAKGGTWALQSAIYERLKTNADLGGIVGERLYDMAAQGARFPYATLGEFRAEPWGSKTSTGESVTFRVHVWSQYSGQKQAHETLEIIRDSLMKTALVVEGFDVIRLQHISSETMIERDAWTIHGIGRYKAVLFKK